MSGDGCIFCRIVAGAFGTEFVGQNAHAVAFRDIQPQAPVHILVVPRVHVSALSDVAGIGLEAAGACLDLARHVALDAGIAESGYRVITNEGPDAGQTVFHLHFHVLGGARLGGHLVPQ